MARGRRRSSAVANANATRSVLRQMEMILAPQAILSRHSYLPGDRRLFDPAHHVNAPTRFGYQFHRLVVPRVQPNVNRAMRGRSLARSVELHVPHAVAFADPKKVSVCIRRHTRREVLFATGGAGKRSKRPPRRNWTSEIKC